MLDVAEKQLGFVATNFDGHPAGHRHFEPRRHYTWKGTDSRNYQSTWRSAVELAERTAFVGYLEAEHIAFDIDLPNAPFLRREAPFLIHRRALTEKEAFRQSELHLTFDTRRSSADLATMLLEAGLYGAFLPKRDRTDLVLTAQGRRSDISRLAEQLLKYLRAVGGTVGASLKEERVIAYRTFHIAAAELPEVIDRVEWFDDRVHATDQPAT